MAILVSFVVLAGQAQPQNPGLARRQPTAGGRSHLLFQIAPKHGKSKTHPRPIPELPALALGIWASGHPLGIIYGCVCVWCASSPLPPPWPSLAPILESWTLAPFPCLGCSSVSSRRRAQLQEILVSVMIPAQTRP